jgi:regulator of sigma E protease
VGQRFVIFSAGVIMNMVLAVVLFPIAFAGGVSFPKPEIGSVDAGGPAWKAGLQPGDEIDRVSDRRIYGFQDIGVEVAIGDPKGIPLQVRRGGVTSEITVVPKKDEEEGRYRIGILPTVLTKVVPGGPAARAGIKTGDRIVAINGEELAPDTEPLFKLSQLTKAVVTVVGEDGSRKEVSLEATVPPGQEEYRIGIAPVGNIIAGVRGRMAQPDVIAGARAIASSASTTLRSSPSRTGGTRCSRPRTTTAARSPSPSPITTALVAWSRCPGISSRSC